MALTEADEVTSHGMPCFGDGWVGIRLGLGDNDWEHIGEWLWCSWRAVAPKRLPRLTNVATEF